MLKIRDIETGYGKVKILHGVDLTVPNAGIVALLGGNGTGKSTLLKCVSGLLRPWSGTIEFDGQPISRLRPDRIVRLGLVQVTQSKDSFPVLTVEENLRMGAFSRSDKAGISEDMDKVFHYFPVLKERRSQLAATLSGGEIQMMVIGRGLMARPKMIMFDEPSAALSPKVVSDICSAIGRIRDEGITILLVEQNVNMALMLADYGYVIRDGRIDIEGKSDDLLDAASVREAYFGGTVADTSSSRTGGSLSKSSQTDTSLKGDQK